MKVTLTCEKCGHEFYVSTIKTPLNYFHIDNLSEYVCPICNPPEPTYGPLTVEMVAEALAEAYKNPRGEWRGQARFVLRLLKKTAHFAGMFGDIPASVPADSEWRDWLLDLARDK